MTLALKNAMKQMYACKFCNSKFSQPTTLSTHMCVKKQRNLDINSAGSRLGFMAFRRFYELTVSSKTLKVVQDFIDSPYYIQFVKFGNYLAMLKPVNIDQYIDFVIKNGVKLKDWTNESVYDVYILDLLKKEPAVSATERTITCISEWCEDNKIEFNEFFLKITANEATHFIKMGRLSPWVLYLCATGETLMLKFNQDHSKIIGDIIDPGFWMKKFKKNNDDVNFIKEILGQSGL